jgi:AcrR family transcriptional regulator
MPPAGRETSGRSTRDKLLAQGLRLFAERGFDAVSVGEIEQAAGLVPRRGAMYRHFASKDALLEAVVRDYLASVPRVRSQLATLMSGDVHVTAEAVARLVLDELDRQHDIVRVLEQDGDRLPELCETFRRELSEPAYASMADVLLTWWQTTSCAEPPTDVTALAVHLLGGLINARRSTWTFGRPPADLDDERLARAWADLCVRLLGTPP